jgi:uncharacterized membrane protein YphA (DoxX/SURF4 family)
MEAKKVLSIGRLLVLGDILMVTLTIITGLVLTQENALKSMHTYSESVSYTFTIILLLTLILSAVAWTMIFFGKKARWVYIFSIFFNYAPTIAFIWVVNGIENGFGTLRLLISGAIIYHLWANEIETEEKRKPVEKEITDEKLKIEDETLMKESIYLEAK